MLAQELLFALWLRAALMDAPFDKLVAPWRE